MNGNFAEAIHLIISTLGGLFLAAVVLRFLLQAARADFYNPVCQALVKVTSPVLNPLRKVIPGYRGLDFASLTLALVVSCLITSILLAVNGYSPLQQGIGNIIGWSFVGLASFVLDIYFWGLLISIIASWIAPYSGHPILLLIHQLLEPIQSRFRRIIPPLGGLDFSPIFIFLAIRVIDIMVVGSLAQSLRVPVQYVIGI